MREEDKNPSQKCENPNCDNITNSGHSKYCLKCSLRKMAKVGGYRLIEDIDVGDDEHSGYIMMRDDIAKGWKLQI